MNGRRQLALRLGRRVLATAAGVLLLWLCGLVWFVCDGLARQVDRTTPTDAIVVLTGGRLRVESGVDLLEAGRARKLFISGVNQHVDRDDILRAFGPLPDSASCCIVLGHDADNTFGNARETGLWMRQEGYRSLRLVTSWYHMPRSLLEFRREMPDVAIIAYPVFASPVAIESFWARPHSALLVVHEYHKFLAALVRPAVAGFLPETANPDGEPIMRAAGRRQ